MLQSFAKPAFLTGFRSSVDEKRKQTAVFFTHATVSQRKMSSMGFKEY